MRSDFLLGLFALSFAAPQLLAQGAPSNCEGFMKYGIYDKYNVETASSHFKQVQTFLSENHFGSYQEAVDAGSKFGIDIADIASIDFGGHNAKTEWLQWSDSFVHSTFTQVQDNESYRLSIEKVSHEITEIVKACLESNAEGFFAWIEPHADHKTFTFNARYIHLGSHSSTTINSLDFQPSSIRSSCGAQGLATFEPTLHFFKPHLTGSGASVTCSRPDLTTNVVVTINTADGRAAPDLDPYIPDPPAADFSVSPPSVVAGGQSTLSWQLTGAPTASIDNGIGPVGVSGSVVVHPPATTTYVLSATGPGGTVKKSALLTVTPRPQPPPVTITQVWAMFYTDGDDKDRNDGVNESYIIRPGTVVASNNHWGSDLIFRNDATDRGQTFGITVPLSRCNSMVYHYRMDNDDGWKVTFEIHAKYSTDVADQNHIVARSYRDVANGHPREGDIPLRCF